jgi:hypothetical protein
MIHDDGKKKWIEKNYEKKKKKHQQINMDFWMIRFGPYFQKSQSSSFFVGSIFFPPSMYNLFFSKWATFHMYFINWLITTKGPLNIGFFCLFPL